MKKSHRDTAADLQEMASRYHWHVQLSGMNGVKIAKQFNKYVISVILLRNDEGLYDLQPITYEFRSKISFFDYSVPENRYARNKLFFISLFNLLRRANMWDIIANKETYLQPNEECTIARNRKVNLSAALKAVVGGYVLTRKKEHKFGRKAYGDRKVRRKIA